MTSNASFKAFRRFNDDSLQAHTGSRARLDDSRLEHFPGDGLPDKLARELCRRKAFPTKELFESFEFFERVRRRLRRPQVADLCCGHGLTGILFAVFEPQVERVTLVDRRRPPSYDVVLEAVTAVAPWAADKVRFLEISVNEAKTHLTRSCAIIAVHACGVRTDRCIDLALHLQSPIALMPCCYAQTAKTAPRCLRRGLGPALATDVHRTYRLDAAGYDVDWTAVPRAITKMNRVLVGLPPKT